MANLPRLRTFTLAVVLLLVVSLTLTSFSTQGPKIAQQHEATTDKIIEPQTERVSLKDNTAIILTALEIEMNVPNVQIFAVNIIIMLSFMRYNHTNKFKRSRNE
jgi:uncharacterized membrane protein YeiB